MAFIATSTESKLITIYFSRIYKFDGHGCTRKGLEFIVTRNNKGSMGCAESSTATSQSKNIVALMHGRGPPPLSEGNL